MTLSVYVQHPQCRGYLAPADGSSACRPTAQVRPAAQRSQPEPQPRRLPPTPLAQVFGLPLRSDSITNGETIRSCLRLALLVLFLFRPAGPGARGPSPHAIRGTVCLHALAGPASECLHAVAACMRGTWL